MAEQVVSLGGDTENQELQGNLQGGEIMRGPTDQAQHGSRSTTHGLQLGVKELCQERAAEGAVRGRLRPELIMLEGSRQAEVTQRPPENHHPIRAPTLRPPRGRT